MSLPLAAKVVVQGSSSGTGRGVGNVFAINTIGTVIGSLMAGLILIPILGIIPLLIMTLVLNTLLGIWIIRTLNFHVKRFIIGAISLVALGILLLQAADIPSWKYTIMLSEVTRKINRKQPPKTFKEFKSFAQKHDEILFYKEGVNGTFIVTQTNEVVYLFTNGKGDASSKGDLRTQTSLGMTPMILHPKPEHVFVIGFGAGTTIGNVMLHEDVKQAYVAEISAEVIDASIHFEHINHRPLEDPRLTLIKDDGIASLRLTNNKYDVIISQPSNPWSAGVGNLFTTDFFQSCKEKLQPGGYLAQWINLYETDDRTFRMVLRTLLQEFDHVNLWHIGTSDVLMICSNEPMNRNIPVIEKRYEGVRQYMGIININSFAAFLSQELIVDRQLLEEYAGKGEINTQNHPILEYWASKAYFENATPTEFVGYDERNNIDSSQLLIQQYLYGHSPSKNDILEAGLFQSLGGSKTLAHYFAELNPDIYDMWAKQFFDAGKNDDYLSYSEKASIVRQKLGIDREISLIQKDLSLRYYNQGSAFMSQNKLDQAIRYLKAAIRADTSHVNAYTNLATVYGKKQEYVNAIKLLDRAEKIDPTNSKIYFNRAYAKGFIANEDGAIKDFTRCIELSPENGRAYLLRGQVYLALKNRDAACSDFKMALSLGENQAMQAYQETCKD
jgi:spermidine synthase